MNESNNDIKQKLLEVTSQSYHKADDIGMHPIIKIVLEVNKESVGLLNLGNKKTYKGRTNNNQYLATAMYHLIGGSCNSDLCAALASSLGATSKKEEKQLPKNKTRWIKNVTMNFLEKLIMNRDNGTMIMAATTIATTSVLESSEAETMAAKNQPPLSVITNIARQTNNAVSPLQIGKTTTTKPSGLISFFTGAITSAKSKTTQTTATAASTTMTPSSQRQLSKRNFCSPNRMKFFLPELLRQNKQTNQQSTPSKLFFSTDGANSIENEPLSKINDNTCEKDLSFVISRSDDKEEVEEGNLAGFYEMDVEEYTKRRIKMELLQQPNENETKLNQLKKQLNETDDTNAATNLIIDFLFETMYKKKDGFKSLLEHIESRTKTRERKVIFGCVDYLACKMKKSNRTVLSRYNILVSILKIRNINPCAKDSSRRRYKKEKQKEMNQIIESIILYGKKLQQVIIAGTLSS